MITNTARVREGGMMAGEKMVFPDLLHDRQSIIEGSVQVEISFICRGNLCRGFAHPEIFTPW